MRGEPAYFCCVVAGSALLQTDMEENISRSGRVRKKSSKLSDYQSPDDVDLHSKVGRVAVVSGVRRGEAAMGEGLGHTSSLSQAHQVDYLPPAQLLDSEDEPTAFLSPGLDLKIEDGLDMDIDMKEEDLDEIPDDLDEDDIDVEDEHELIVEDLKDHGSKTEIIKKPHDLPSVETKRRRRDKGKSRVSAYMLWAKTARASLLAAQPGLDFATVSRKLGEQWAAVPCQEKYNWKRRARRLCGLSPARPARSLLASTKSTVVVGKHRLAPAAVMQTVRAARAGLPASQPLDLAAHLTLLGESLSIIGEVRIFQFSYLDFVSGCLAAH